MNSPELADQGAQSTAPSEPQAPGELSSVSEVERFLRTEFLHRLAHDLRGHAGVIHGALQELEATFTQPQAEASATFFAMAKRGVKRILRTAERLQQTGQLERNEPMLSLAECDVRALVQQAAEEAHGVEGRKKISVELDMPGAIVAARADSYWLTSAFFELTSNAVRHAQSRVRVTLSTRDDQISVEFADDGRSGGGPFGPTRFVTPRDRRGLGLGLSIVHDVAIAHNGSIQLRSGAPEGADPFVTKVTLTIPRNREDAA